MALCINTKTHRYTPGPLLPRSSSLISNQVDPLKPAVSVVTLFSLSALIGSTGKHIVQHSGTSHSILGSAPIEQSDQRVSRTPKPSIRNSHIDWAMRPDNRLSWTKNAIRFDKPPAPMLGTDPVSKFPLNARLSREVAFPMFSGILPSKLLSRISMVLIFGRLKSLIGNAPVNWLLEKMIVSRSIKSVKTSRIVPVNWLPATENISKNARVRYLALTGHTHTHTHTHKETRVEKPT